MGFTTYSSRLSHPGVLLAISLLLAACQQQESAVVESVEPAASAPVEQPLPEGVLPDLENRIDTAEADLRSNPAGDDLRSIYERVTSGFVSPGRPREDLSAHNQRQPAAVLEWAGIGEAMSVLDVAAYGGYYTENVSWAVGPEGWVVSHNTSAILDRSAETGEVWQKRLAGNRLRNVDTFIGSYSEIADHYDEEFDAITLINTFHDTYNFAGEAAGRALLENLFSVLKPGGFLLLIDHQGVLGNDNVSLHRIDPSQVRHQLELAGFEITDQSSILQSADDDQNLNIFDPEVRGKTSRFILKAEKPADATENP